MLLAPRLRVAAVLAVALGLLVACDVTSPRENTPPTVAVTAPVVGSREPVPTPGPAPALGPEARIVEHAGNTYRVVALPLADWDVRVEWEQGERGQMLADVLADPTVVVATNAGIYTPELAPGGLLVEGGVELRALNLADGEGNFHLKPNGVFAVKQDGSAVVIDSTTYDPAGVEFATQSGPALVLGGVIHPQFKQGSTNLAFRSGVGVSPDGSTVYLALSTSLTNLYDFATLFTDVYGCVDALYLDGNVSALWVAGDGDPGPFSGPYAGIITARARAGT